MHRLSGPTAKYEALVNVAGSGEETFLVLAGLCARSAPMVSASREIARRPRVVLGIPQAMPVSSAR